jgi:phage/plasmid-associated DNA primase
MTETNNLATNLLDALVKPAVPLGIIENDNNELKNQFSVNNSDVELTIEGTGTVIVSQRHVELAQWRATYESRGWKTIPLKADKMPWCKWANESDIKEHYWYDDNTYNIGIRTGPISGLVVVDIDEMKEFDEMVAQHGWPETYRVRSGRASIGYHLYFIYNERVAHIPSGSKKAMAADGHYLPWDFKSGPTNHLVVAPPSIHPKSGKRYVPENEPILGEMPDWMLLLFNRGLSPQGPLMMDMKPLGENQSPKRQPATPVGISKRIVPPLVDPKVPLPVNKLVTIAQPVLVTEAEAVITPASVNCTPTTSIVPSPTKKLTMNVVVTPQITEEGMRELLSLLNPNRFARGNNSEWTYVLWSVHDANPKFKHLAREITELRLQPGSTKLDKFDKTWNAFDPKRITGVNKMGFGSLMQSLEQDIGSEAYNAFKVKHGLTHGFDKKKVEYLRFINRMNSKTEEEVKSDKTISQTQAMSGLNYDVANAMLFSCYKEGSIYYDTEQSLYYIWSNEKRIWEKCNKEYVKMEIFMPTYHKLLRDDNDAIISKIIKLRSIIKDDNDPKNKEVAILEIESKKLINLIGKLATKNYVCDVMAMIQEITTDHNRAFAKTINPVTPWIPTNDGKLFNIFTHEVRYRVQTDHYTDTINAKYSLTQDKDKLETVKNFFTDICKDRQDIADFLVIALGVFISGSLRDRKFMVWYGKVGNNGKTLLLNILKTLLVHEVYYHTLGANAFNQSKNTEPNAHTAHLMGYIGKRLVTKDEQKAEIELDSELIKQLGGDGGLTLRDCGEKQSPLPEITAHTVIAGNNMPVIIPDAAIIGRTVVVPFEVHYCEDPNSKENPDGWDPRVNIKRKIDYTLNDKFTHSDYLDVFFYLFANGAKSWYDNKKTYIIPEACTDAKSLLLSKFGPFTDFFRDCCDFHPSYQIMASELLDSFKAFYRGFPSYCKNVDAFYKRMKAWFPNPDPNAKRPAYATYYGVRVMVVDATPIQQLNATTTVPSQPSGQNKV